MWCRVHASGFAIQGLGPRLWAQTLNPKGFGLEFGPRYRRTRCPSVQGFLGGYRAARGEEAEELERIELAEGTEELRY